MPTTTTAAIWMNENGLMACTEHAGTALACAVEHDADAASHVTELGTWVRVTAAMVDRWAGMLSPEAAAELATCETCKFWRR